MKTQYALIVLIGMFVLTACQPLKNTPSPMEGSTIIPVETRPVVAGTIKQTTMPVAQTDVPAEPPVALPPVKIGTPSPFGQKMALLSQADLSKRLNIGVDEITIKAVQPVVWPDSSLGCPQPDFAYSQIPANGFIVVLEVAPNQFLYHTDEVSTVVFCPKPSVMPDFPVTPSDIQDGKPWMPVN
jgi:hypothetical protein